jgi:archaellum biogenesis ATPase FlaH
MKIKDADISAPRLLLLYGAGGTGKTALVSQLKDGYLMDFDRGLLTCKLLKDKFTAQRQEIEFDTFFDKKTEDSDAWMKAKAKLIDIQNQVFQGKWKHSGLIIDSLTGMCRAITRHVMATAGQSPNDVPKIQHYGAIVNELDLALTITRSLDCLVILTAHENLIETDDGNYIRIMSATRSHGINKIPWLFDEVLYTKKVPRGGGIVEYVVTGKSTSTIATKTRSGIDYDIVVGDKGLDSILEKMQFKTKELK